MMMMMTIAVLMAAELAARPSPTGAAAVATTTSSFLMINALPVVNCGSLFFANQRRAKDRWWSKSEIQSRVLVSRNLWRYRAVLACSAIGLILLLVGCLSTMMSNACAASSVIIDCDVVDLEAPLTAFAKCQRGGENIVNIMCRSTFVVDNNDVSCPPLLPRQPFVAQTQTLAGLDEVVRAPLHVIHVGPLSDWYDVTSSWLVSLPGNSVVVSC
jgi:hypothetical protein